MTASVRRRFAIWARGRMDNDRSSPPSNPPGSPTDCAVDSTTSPVRAATVSDIARVGHGCSRKSLTASASSGSAALRRRSQCETDELGVAASGSAYSANGQPSRSGLANSVAQVENVSCSHMLPASQAWIGGPWAELIGCRKMLETSATDVIAAAIGRRHGAALRDRTGRLQAAGWPERLPPPGPSNRTNRCASCDRWRTRTRIPDWWPELPTGTGQAS